MSENTLSFNKTFLLFVMVAAGTIAAAVIATMPTAGRLMARESSFHRPCRLEQVALDRGYGVSRFVQRRVCDDL